MEEPPLLIYIGQACYQCFTEQTELNSLQRCTGCLRVSYCGADCQKENWPRHKALCKAYKKLETDPAYSFLSQFSVYDADNTNVDELNKLIGAYGPLLQKGLEQQMRRPLRVDERNLVGWEPHCLACGRCDTTMSVARKPGSTPFSLTPCAECKLSFYCSQQHWEAARVIHHESTKDAHDGLSQCEMNKLCLQDARFSKLISAANQGEFQWAPERTLSSWSSLKGVGWTDFSADCKRDFNPRDDFLQPMLRRATESLSFPMTILWGLENLNSNEEWTKKEVLNVHILGAADKEVMSGQIFEEILHRLPAVKVLKAFYQFILNIGNRKTHCKQLTLCGPDLYNITGPQPKLLGMDTCPECSRKGRKRTVNHIPSTYHEYVTEQGAGFVNPDISVAFNSGCSEEEANQWMTTLVLLVQRNIPSLFTSYNIDEALADAKCFEKAGAHLHPALGPVQNPWKSLLARKEPNKVTGYYAVNGYLSGGFG